MARDDNPNFALCATRLAQRNGAENTTEAEIIGMFDYCLRFRPDHDVSGGG